MDKPADPRPPVPLRCARRTRPVHPLPGTRASPYSLLFDLRMRLRHHAEIQALDTSLHPPPLTLRREPTWRISIERAAFVLGALGILGFVAACLGIARGSLDVQSYLALSLTSLADYTVALLVVRYSSRRSKGPVRRPHVDTRGWPLEIPRA